ncbi:hypothetical protein [Streptomyces sp. NPDC002490]
MAIRFGHDRPWGGVSQHEYRRMAQHSGPPLAALLGKEGKPLPSQ